MASPVTSSAETITGHEESSVTVASTESQTGTRVFAGEAVVGGCAVAGLARRVTESALAACSIAVSSIAAADVVHKRCKVDAACAAVRVWSVAAKTLAVTRSAHA